MARADDAHQHFRRRSNANRPPRRRRLPHARSIAGVSQTSARNRQKSLGRSTRGAASGGGVIKNQYERPRRREAPRSDEKTFIRFLSCYLIFSRRLGTRISHAKVVLQKLSGRRESNPHDLSADGF